VRNDFHGPPLLVIGYYGDIPHVDPDGADACHREQKQLLTRIHECEEPTGQ